MTTLKTAVEENQRFKINDRVKRPWTADPDAPNRDQKGSVVGFDWTYVLVHWDGNDIPGRHKPEDLTLTCDCLSWWSCEICFRRK